MKILFASIVLLLTSLHAMAQGACYPAGTVVLDTGRPANSASVRVCTSGSTGTPCTPAASLFTDPTLGTPLVGSPTITTDARGNYGFCAAAGVNYDLQISGTGITPLTIRNLPLPPTTPITAASLTSASANPANVGLIKMASGDCLDWRNNANTGNIQLCKTTADALDLTAFSAVNTSSITATSVTATSGVPFTGLSGSSNNMQINLGRAATEANIAVPQSNGFYFTNSDLAAGDLVFRINSSTNRVYLGAGAGIAPVGISNTGLNLYGSTSGKVALSAPAAAGATAISFPASSGVAVVDTATQTLTNKTLGGTTPFNRLKANQGSSLVVGDVALSGGWGTTASVTLASGSDATGQINILSNGTGQAANATFTLTFHDGTWTTAPLCLVVRADGNAPSGAMIPNAPSATAVTFFFSGTPVAATTYSADFICLGR